MYNARLRLDWIWGSVRPKCVRNIFLWCLSFFARMRGGRTCRYLFFSSTLLKFCFMLQNAEKKSKSENCCFAHLSNKQPRKKGTQRWLSWKLWFIYIQIRRKRYTGDKIIHTHASCKGSSPGIVRVSSPLWINEWSSKVSLEAK